MKLWVGLIVSLALLSGCAAAEAPADGPPAVEAPAVAEPAPTPLPPPPPPIVLPADPASGNTSTIVPQDVSALPLATSDSENLSCHGAFAQGGIAICRTRPGAAIEVDGVHQGQADAQGFAIIGFDRDAGSEAIIRVTLPRSYQIERVSISPRNFSVQRIDGLPQQTVTPTDPVVLARIRRESAAKQEGFASRAALEGFLQGFIWPVEGRISGPWGNQRVLNGTPSTPHYGIDIAAPTGTPIRAPAPGVVSFANADMHYEGGLIFIDHGQGLITMYLHMSRLDVAVGDTVAQGQVIGAVGSTGRATGPHLCWRMKWRDRQLDPSFAILGLAAARQGLAQD